MYRVFPFSVLPGALPVTTITSLRVPPLVASSTFAAVALVDVVPHLGPAVRAPVSGFVALEAITLEPALLPLTSAILEAAFAVVGEVLTIGQLLAVEFDQRRVDLAAGLDLVAVLPH